LENPNLIKIGQKIQIPKKSVVVPFEEKEHSFDTIQKHYETINKKSDLDIINYYQKNKSDYYLVEDKKNDTLGLYKQGKLVKLIKGIVSGANSKNLDDMTTTVIKDGKLVLGAGNLSTPAGIFIASPTIYG
jgi:malic enzyme